MNKEEAKKQIDVDDASINGVKLITTRRAKEIIDAIDDHPKVKLPREVGEELDTWIANNQDGYVGSISDLCGSLWDQIQELSATATFTNKSEENYFKVIDAYRYGWKAEPESKWYVQTPKEWWAQPDAPEYMSLDQLGVVSGIGSKKLADKFTRAELKKYHFDSGIFTLVPVENEEVSQ